MKHGSFRVFCLVLLAGVALAAFGDEFTVNLESRVVDDFDNTDDAKFDWIHNWSYEVTASRYAVGMDPADKDDPKFKEFELDSKGGFPRFEYVKTWPMALYRTNRDNLPLKSLGIHGKFKRMGYNWVDVFPTLKSAGDSAAPHEISLPGRVRYLDVWAWGSGLNYYMEAYLRDQQGIVHALYLGNLGFRGWKNLRIQLPTSIPQRRKIIVKPEDADYLNTDDRNRIYLKFVKFRIWTTPGEEVADFYVYLDHFKILTDTFETLFDGDDLTDPNWIHENWDGDGSGGSNAGSTNTGSTNGSN